MKTKLFLIALFIFLTTSLDVWGQDKFVVPGWFENVSSEFILFPDTIYVEKEDGTQKRYIYTPEKSSNLDSTMFSAGGIPNDSVIKEIKYRCPNGCEDMKFSVRLYRGWQYTCNICNEEFIEQQLLTTAKAYKDSLENAKLTELTDYYIIEESVNIWDNPIAINSSRIDSLEKRIAELEIINYIKKINQ